MAITYKVENERIELPKLTVSLSEKSDAVQEAKTPVERYQAMYDFLDAVFDTETLEKAVDGDSMEECDIVKLSVVFDGVEAAYEKPILEASKKRINAQVDTVEKAMKVTRAAQSRQGMQAV